MSRGSFDQPSQGVVRSDWKAHNRTVVQEPAMPISDELAALLRRADKATAAAHRLLDENERWRRSVERQLDYMFELGAEFRRPALSRAASTLPGPPAGDI